MLRVQSYIKKVNGSAVVDPKLISYSGPQAPNS